MCTQAFLCSFYYSGLKSLDKIVAMISDILRGAAGGLAAAATAVAGAALTRIRTRTSSITIADAITINAGPSGVSMAQPLAGPAALIVAVLGTLMIDMVKVSPSTSIS
jgi:hypothetical protein